MRTFTKALAGVLLAAVAVLGAITLLGTTVLAGSPVMEALSAATGGAGALAANAALDASGLKQRADEALRSRAGAIAAATGMSEGQVDAAIDALAIESWEVAALPEDARATGSSAIEYQGAQATLVTYDDPSYVTVETAGQRVTFAVPASAQGYADLLAYL